MSDNKEKADPSRAVELQIEWFVPDGMKSIFANNMMVQQDDSEVYLSFFEAAPPVFTSLADAEEKLKNALNVRATCVARIAINKARLPGLIKALQTQLSVAADISALEKLVKT